MRFAAAAAAGAARAAGSAARAGAGMAGWQVGTQGVACYSTFATEHLVTIHIGHDVTAVLKRVYYRFDTSLAQVCSMFTTSLWWFLLSSVDASLWQSYGLCIAVIYIHTGHSSVHFHLFSIAIQQSTAQPTAVLTASLRF